MLSTLPLRHPSDFARFPMIGDRIRTTMLDDRATANLLVTTSDGHTEQAQVADLAEYVPAGTVMVLNTSGTFFARVRDAQLPDGGKGTVHFAQMRDDAAHHWIVVVPSGLAANDFVQLPGGAGIRLIDPYLIRGVQATWKSWGEMWIAKYEGPDCFDSWSAEFACAINDSSDPHEWRLDEMQNAYSTRPTSARVNNGGRNLTAAVLRSLCEKGVQIATLEMRTGVGNDHDGIPLPEFVRLDRINATTINIALDRGSLILPVGTGVIRALDWCYRSDEGQVQAGEGWCNNLITPDHGGTWLNSWVSGMHEPDSTHLAMGAAVMGEDLMRWSMMKALEWDFWFHVNGDTHLHLPSIG